MKHLSTSSRQKRWAVERLVLLCSLFLISVGRGEAWGTNHQTSQESVYGNRFDNDWMNSGSTLSFQVDGCAWGYTYDSEEAGCLEDESEEGTTNWYMMANCRRPQVAFSVFKGNSCSSGNFVGSYVTKFGVAEFVYYLQQFDANYANDDNGNGDLPNCEGGDNGYLGLDCDENGGFAINYFNDQYCVSRTGNTYDQLNGLNNVINNYKSCHQVYANGNDDGGMMQKLVYYSEPCMSSDYSYCSDSYEYSQRASRSGFASVKTNKWSSRAAFGAHKSWVTKLKYVIGGLFLLASFIMFTGILFTNRRRRRAMMMRKYRQAKREKRAKKSGKSRSSSRRRSKSRNKERDDGGVLT